MARDFLTRRRAAAADVDRQQHPPATPAPVDAGLLAEPDPAAGVVPESDAEEDAEVPLAQQLTLVGFFGPPREPQQPCCGTMDAGPPRR